MKLSVKYISSIFPINSRQAKTDSTKQIRIGIENKNVLKKIVALLFQYLSTTTILLKTYARLNIYPASMAKYLLLLTNSTIKSKGNKTST